MADEPKRNGNGVIKKAHVTYTVAIILGTVSVLAWLNSTYVTAKEFTSFKELTLSSLSRIDLNNRKTQLSMRNKMLEDRLFELQASEQLSIQQQAIVERITREMLNNEKEITNLQRQLSRLVGYTVETSE